MDDRFIFEVATQSGMKDIGEFIDSNIYSEERINAKFRDVHDSILRHSRHIDSGNFVNVCSNDLGALFEIYDNTYFMGELKKLLGATPLKFRLSKRMTRAAGKTTVFKKGTSRTYEIAIAIDMLYINFKKEGETFVVNGIQCRNRLESMLRVMEHEIVHLIEFLMWTESSCSRSRFHSIAKRFFGHTHYRHELPTRREQAADQFGIKVGSRVSFSCSGKNYDGIVNYIGKRATVLVESSSGVRYSNGCYYHKFHVPLGALGGSRK